MTTSETETLRAAIEAALRRRDPEAEVTIASLSTPLGSVHYTASVMVLAARIAGDRSTERGALESLAVAAGLRVETCGSCGGRGQRLYAREVEDGCDACECAGVVVVDPAEEVARLTMALDDANNLASCQRDTIETLTRALHDAADRLGCADYDDACAAVADALDDVTRGALDDLAKVRAELDAARLALVDAAPWCDAPMCHAPATHWRPAGQRSERACDSHAIGDPAWDEDEHAAALRAAEASQ